MHHCAMGDVRRANWYLGKILIPGPAGVDAANGCAMDLLNINLRLAAKLLARMRSDAVELAPKTVDMLSGLTPDQLKIIEGELCESPVKGRSINEILACEQPRLESEHRILQSNTSYDLHVRRRLLLCSSTTSVPHIVWSPRRIMTWKKKVEDSKQVRMAADVPLPGQTNSVMACTS